MELIDLDCEQEEKSQQVTSTSSPNQIDTIDLDDDFMEQVIQAEEAFEKNKGVDDGKKIVSLSVEAAKSELMGIDVPCAEEAYNLYNDYAFRMGFSIRKSKQHMSQIEGRGLTMKQFCCSKAGFKKDSGNKLYGKSDVRTGCKAFIKFMVDKDGVYLVTKHRMEHNHGLCPYDKCHLLRSHRNLSKHSIDFLMEMCNAGIKLSAAFRVLRDQVGGESNVGFIKKDAYNAIAQVKKSLINKNDANTMIGHMEKSQAEDSNFFFKFELGDGASLNCVFWRDSQMLVDYECFGDCVCVDATYRTNTFGLKCVPFVGLNNHGKNIMFGCALMKDETTASYTWLFKAFLNSMHGKEPETIMTDQSAAMAAAINVIFTKAHHRLCVWHLMENAKKNIRDLLNEDGFRELLATLFKFVDTEAEFEFIWSRLDNEFKDCKSNGWMQRLYNIRDKWCPAFSKDNFSGGILSSQRSESTNYAISRRLNATSSLCDFYQSFVQVVNDWRSNVNVDDFRSLEGNPQMVTSEIGMLVHARKVYTPEIYVLFEKEYLKGLSFEAFYQGKSGDFDVFHVARRNGCFRHVLQFNDNEKIVLCTCNMYAQVGIPCSHALRVIGQSNWGLLPTHYIKKRWTKTAEGIARNVPSESNSGTDWEVYLVWKSQKMKQFNQLSLRGRSDSQKRKDIDNALLSIQNMWGEDDVGTIDPNINDQGCSVNIENPIRTRVIGERNVRRKSVIEKACNIAKGRKARSLRVAQHTNSYVDRTSQGIVGQGYLIPPPDGGPFFIPCPDVRGQSVRPTFASTSQEPVNPTFAPSTKPYTPRRPSFAAYFQSNPSYQ